MRIRKKTMGLIVAAFVVVMAFAVPAFAETGTADESTGLVGGVCRGIGSMGTAIADLFGMTPDEMAAARNDGQSLSDLAQSKGVDQQTLVDTMLAERKEMLAQAVKDGRLTQEQADAMLERMTSRVQERVDDPSVGPRGNGGGCGGFGGGAAGSGGGGCGGPGGGAGAGGGCGGFGGGAGPAANTSI
ncbi:MAG: hypothetical protein ACYC33_02170 [Thermoleophilia bacterium]